MPKGIYPGNEKFSIGDFINRFDVVESGCWMWKASKIKTGRFGHYPVFGRQGYAHRWSYEYFVAKIPEGFEIDHRCKLKLCVNPFHLEPVRHRENMIRAGVKGSQETCKNGHDLNDPNNWVYRARNGGLDSRQKRRECRTCHNERTRKSRARAKIASSKNEYTQ